MYITLACLECLCPHSVCDQWWLSKEFGYLCACLHKTPVFQNNSTYTNHRGVVQETLDQSFFISRCNTVRLQYVLSESVNYIYSSFYCALGVVSIDEEVSHFIGLLFEVCIIRTHANKFEELEKSDNIFRTRVVR